MFEKNRKQSNMQSDFNQFYTVMNGYVKYCIRKPKTKLTDEEKENLSEDEREKKEEELKAAVQEFEMQQKSFQKAYETMCNDISKGGICYLSTYVDVLKKMYQEKSDWKREIKEALVNQKSLKLFKEAQSNMTELYPILLTVNKTFPVENYSELSLSPKAAMYGSEVNKTQRGSIKKAPLGNEEIQAMLNLFIEMKDYKCLGNWLMAILAFSSDQLVDVYQEKFIPEREQLKAWAYKKIDTNDSYKRAVVDTLFKGKMVNKLIDAFAKQPVMNAKQIELEEKVTLLEEANEKEMTSHIEQREKQYAIIKEKEAIIAELKQKAKELEQCSQKLTMYIEKYQAQVGINERITRENDRRIQETGEAYKHMQEMCNEMVSQLEALKLAHSALQSDFSLKNNELLRLQETTAKRTETARTDVMRELVTGINEQFYYLTMFYLELKENGKLEEESIELFADTLNNIDEVLAGLGIKKIGIIDQKVSYDASIHNSTDAKTANGEQVVVSGYGWKIGGEVYIKAPVEKGE